MSKSTGPVQAISSDIFGTSSAQEHNLGALIETTDGRKFRYCKAGASALVVGKLQDGPAIVANHVNIAVAAAAAIGATSVTVTLGATAVTANQYTNGYLVISDAAGEGYTYQIKSHPAADASASLVLTLDDEDAIKVALTTSSEATLVQNQYSGVIIHASTETGVPVGGAQNVISAGEYGWLQTRGPIAMLGDATVAATGLPVAASATTDGSVTLGTGALVPVGSALTASVSTEYRPIFLFID